MTSIRDRDAGRDADHYDDDRKEGRYAPGGDRAHWYPAETDDTPRPVAPRTNWLALAADILIQVRL